MADMETETAGADGAGAAGADTAVLPLRQRQKQQARTAIHHAALDLIEEQGIAATTVQQIADRAGISARTFFRYYPSKERAILLADQMFEDRIEQLELSDCRDASEALERIELLMREFVAKDSDPDMAQHRRITRLLKRQPEFRSLILAQEMDLAEALRRHLARQAPQIGAPSAAVIAQLALTAWRVGWDRWAEQELAGGGSRPVEHFDEARTALRGVLAPVRPAGA